jgi:hypothetical protein
MKIDVSMAADQHKFSVNSWWATSPDFVLYSLDSQLKAAAAIWPELEGCVIRVPIKEEEKPDASTPSGSEG